MQYFLLNAANHKLQILIAYFQSCYSLIIKGAFLPGIKAVTNSLNQFFLKSQIKVLLVFFKIVIVSWQSSSVSKFSNLHTVKNLPPKLSTCSLMPVLHRCKTIVPILFAVQLLAIRNNWSNN